MFTLTCQLGIQHDSRVFSRTRKVGKFDIDQQLPAAKWTVISNYYLNKQLLPCQSTVLLLVMCVFDKHNCYYSSLELLKVKWLVLLWVHCVFRQLPTILLIQLIWILHNFPRFQNRSIFFTNPTVFTLLIFFQLINEKNKLLVNQVCSKEVFFPFFIWLAFWHQLFIISMQGGMYILYLMDAYACGWVMLTVALLQCLSISLVYGMFSIFHRLFNFLMREKGRALDHRSSSK